MDSWPSHRENVQLATSKSAENIGDGTCAGANGVLSDFFGDKMAWSFSPKRSHHGYHRFPHWNWQLSGKSHFQTHPDIPYFLVFCPWHSHFLSIESPCYLHSTRWCPPVISWFIIPLTIDISTISPSEIRVINQLSYLGGTTLYPSVYWTAPTWPVVCPWLLASQCHRIPFDLPAAPTDPWDLPCGGFSPTSCGSAAAFG